jgi:hypothetical protein
MSGVESTYDDLKDNYGAIKKIVDTNSGKIKDVSNVIDKIKDVSNSIDKIKDVSDPMNKI